MVVEKASSMSHEAFVTKNQIERLSLRNTTFASRTSTAKREDVQAPGFAYKDFLPDRTSEDKLVDPTSSFYSVYRQHKGGTLYQSVTCAASYSVVCVHCLDSVCGALPSEL
jgi:hypothetical protein